MFLLGESQGWGSLVGCPLWGLTESDMTEVMKQQWLSGKKFTYQCRELRFYPWIRKIPLEQEMGTLSSIIA